MRKQECERQQLNQHKSRRRNFAPRVNSQKVNRRPNDAFDKRKAQPPLKVAQTIEPPVRRQKHFANRFVILYGLPIVGTACRPRFAQIFAPQLEQNFDMTE